MSSETSIHYRLALVTGATSEIGREIVSMLLGHGAVVCAFGRDQIKLKQLRVAMQDNQLLKTFQADLRSAEEIDRAVAEVLSQCGPPDVFIHVAGVWHDDKGKFKDVTLDEIPGEQIDDVLAVGVRAAMHLSKAMLPGMKAAGKGAIVYTSCGFAGPHEGAGWIHYFVSNQALDALTRSLAEESRPFGVRVNAVAPWFVATAPVKQYFPETAPNALLPAEVAEIVGFLIGPQAGNISGQVIDIRSPKDH